MQLHVRTLVFSHTVLTLGNGWHLQVGIIPSLNIAAGLIGFVSSKMIVALLAKCGIRRTFTRQENTVIQTCVVACYGLAFSGGFTNYLVGLLCATGYLRDTVESYAQPILRMLKKRNHGLLLDDTACPCQVFGGSCK